MLRRLKFLACIGGALAPLLVPEFDPVKARATWRDRTTPSRPMEGLNGAPGRLSGTLKISFESDPFFESRNIGPVVRFGSRLIGLIVDAGLIGRILLKIFEQF